MPVDFGVNTNDRLNRMRRLFDNPTGWGSRCIDTLAELLDADEGLLNSVAAVDAGSNEGNAPIIDASGGVGGDIADATTDRAGLITRAQAPTISEAEAAVRAVVSVIGGGNLDIIEPGIRFIRPLGSRRVEDDDGNLLYYQTTRALLRLDTNQNESILLIATEGQDAPRPDDTDTSVEDVVLLSNTRYDNDTERIYLNNGGTQTVRSPTGEVRVELPPLANRVYPVSGNQVDRDTGGIDHLNAAQLSAFGFTWGIILKGWGARGGVRGISDITGDPHPTPGLPLGFAYSNRMRTAGVPGDLLIAYKPAQATVYYESTHSFLFRHRGSRKSSGGQGYTLEILL